jgi:hypothetical protein
LLEHTINTDYQSLNSVESENAGEEDDAQESASAIFAKECFGMDGLRGIDDDVYYYYYYYYYLFIFSFFKFSLSL